MRTEGSRPATRKLRASHAALLALFLASCTATGLDEISAGVTAPGLASNGAADASGAAETSALDGAITPLTVEQEAELGFAPGSKPVSEAQGDAAAAPAAQAGAQPDGTVAAAASEAGAAEKKTEPGPAEAKAEGTAEATKQVVNAYAAAAEPKKRGFLAGLFSQEPQEAPVMSAPAPKPKPVIELASIEPEEKKSAARASVSGDFDFPGVRRQTSLFEISRKSGVDDDADIDLHEDEDYPVQVASAAGLGRLAPNGLLKQRESVDVACLKPSLVRMLKQVEQHFGRKVVVTSGYRSPAYNRQVRGARRSMHMFCAAADVQVAGVGKWELARYVRTLPGRGGVGTYCHTESVHIDVGPERDWNWKCRSRRKS